MHSAAVGSIGPLTPYAETPLSEVTKEVAEVGHTIEVVTLNEEDCQEAAQKLKERQNRNRPMNASKFQCRTKDDEHEHRAKILAKKEMHPLKKLAFNRISILTWGPALNRKTVQADLIAGLTVGVMVIPQGMSYAAIAGLPYIYGLYAACIPAAVYCLLGQSRQLAVGPVAMVSLLVQAGLEGTLTEEECPAYFASKDESKTQAAMCPDEYVKLAILTACVVGIMQIVGSVLNAGFLVSFLGHPVTSGFTSGAAIIIGLSQLKYFLGYDIPKSQYVHETIGNIIMNLGKTNVAALLLGLLWLTCLVVNKEYVVKKWKKLSLLGALGPLISCVIGILLLKVIPALHDDLGVSYIGDIPSGLMPLTFDSLGNLGKISRVLPTALSCCLIGYMESIAIGKNLAGRNQYEIDAGQEMLALGVAVFVGSLFSCYPVTGSFSRSAVNNSTGAQSQLSGLVTAQLLFCTMLFLTPLFYTLPKFTLAAVVLSSVYSLIAYKDAKELYKVKKSDFMLWVVAFIGTLVLGVIVGISVAIGLSLVIVIYQSARPQISILWRIPGTTIYRNMKQEGSGAFIPNVFICRIGSSMYFANASYVKDMILTYVSDLEEINKIKYVVLEMTPVVTIDSTAVHMIEDMVADFRSRDMEIAFCMVGNRVDKTMRRAKLNQLIGEQWFFPTVHDAVLYCLKHRHVQMQRTSAISEEKNGKIIGNVTFTPEEIKVGTSNEIGISNDMHNSYTVVNITLAKEAALILNDIVAVLGSNGSQIVRYEMEPLGQEESAGQKHAYFLRNIRNKKEGHADEGCKLTEPQIASLKDELDGVIANALRGGVSQRSFFGGMSSGRLLPKSLSGRVGPEEEAKDVATEGNNKLMQSLACTWCSK